MNLGGRVELLLQGEHQQLRDLLPVVDEAVRGLRTPAPDKAQQAAQARSAGSEARGPRPFHPRALSEAWKEFRWALEPHMNHEHDVVLPMLVSVVKDGNVAQVDALKQWVANMRAEHVQLRRLAGIVRVETMPQEVAGIRRTIGDALELFEAHTRTEELALYPALEGGDTSGTVAQHNPDEIMRTLRRARPEPPLEPLEDEPVGFFGRILAIFGR